VDENGSNILTSTDPTGGASAWKTDRVDPGNPPGGGLGVDAVTCPSVALCVASDGSGNILTSTDPTGGAHAWRKAKLDPWDYLNAVTCPSVSLCVAVGAADNIWASTDPTGGKNRWRKVPVDRQAFPPAALIAVSCPSVSLCVVGDSDGDILTSTDPTGGANAWRSAPLDVPGGISERLLVRDDHGTRVVDTAPPGHGNSIGNVALASRVLSWTHDGAQRQLHLR
jgi:hypothetical protein